MEPADDINSHMPDYVVRWLMLALDKRGRPVGGSRILLLGLAYKKNTGDAWESPAVFKFVPQAIFSIIPPCTALPSKKLCAPVSHASLTERDPLKILSRCSSASGAKPPAG